MTLDQEIAEALGFSSVEEMYEHQRLIEHQVKVRRLLKSIIKKSNSIIDIRNLPQYYSND